MTRAPKGIFVGLSTLDVVQLVDQIPAADEKVVARAVSTAAGGPAANAAVAFAALGGVGRLVTRVGADPAGVLVRADLVARHLELINSADPEDAATTVVTALITAATGERAVVSAADHGRSASALARPADAAGDRVDAVADGSGDVAVDVAVDVV
ncbi:MAG: PfkB family carbohydrate kinase, partial [Actinomycetia bacterium]|nr:PfkB family carbohydrate kinase [Actinomycetes bacterium]